MSRQRRAWRTTGRRQHQAHVPPLGLLRSLHLRAYGATPYRPGHQRCHLPQRVDGP